MSRAKKDFMANAIKSPGALHRQLKVPMDKKIPAKKLDAALHSNNPTLKKRAVLAKVMKDSKKAK